MHCCLIVVPSVNTTCPYIQIRNRSCSQHLHVNTFYSALLVYLQRIYNVALSTVAASNRKILHQSDDGYAKGGGSLGDDNINSDDNDKHSPYYPDSSNTELSDDDVEDKSSSNISNLSQLRNLLNSLLDCCEHIGFSAFLNEVRGFLNPAES